MADPTPFVTQSGAFEAVIPPSPLTPTITQSGAFEVLAVVTLPDCSPDTESPFPGTEELISSGTFGRCPPRDFQVSDVKPGQVTLTWTAVTKANLTLDDLLFSVDGDVFADITNPPEHIFASKRSVLGYKLHRGTPGFAPVGTTAGSGNCIADEGTLNAGTTVFVDNTVAPGTTVAYLIATVLDNGA